MMMRSAGLFVALALSGCISKYYWGASLHSDGGALVRPVSRSVFGKTDAHAFLLLKKRAAVLTVVGIDIHSAAHGGADPDVRWMPAALKGWKTLVPR